MYVGMISKFFEAVKQAESWRPGDKAMRASLNKTTEFSRFASFYETVKESKGKIPVVPLPLQMRKPFLSFLFPMYFAVRLLFKNTSMTALLHPESVAMVYCILVAWRRADPEPLLTDVEVDALWDSAKVQFNSMLSRFPVLAWFTAVQPGKRSV